MMVRMAILMVMVRVTRNDDDYNIAVGDVRFRINPNDIVVGEVKSGTNPNIIRNHCLRRFRNSLPRPRIVWADSEFHIPDHDIVCTDSGFRFPDHDIVCADSEFHNPDHDIVCTPSGLDYFTDRDMYCLH